MSERKVLNKYYPPDFDPSKIPRMKLARNRQYTVRLMAPFNMRCKTCGEYIYKGKKFNARKEDVQGEDYLGIRIYRFYIKCTRCLQEISFKTDPKNTDYEIEAGATRNFMALKLAEEQAQREEDEEKEEEATNPMKLLEKRTLQSKHELEVLESLEELKDINRRQQTVNYDEMLAQFDTKTSKELAEQEQEELDEEYIQSVFGKKRSHTVTEQKVVEEDDRDFMEPLRKQIITEQQQKCSVKDVQQKVAENREKKRARLGIRLKANSKPNDKEKQKSDCSAETASTSTKTDYCRDSGSATSETDSRSTSSKTEHKTNTLSTNNESNADGESASTKGDSSADVVSTSAANERETSAENASTLTTRTDAATAETSKNPGNSAITGLSLVNAYSSGEESD